MRYLVIIYWWLRAFGKDSKQIDISISNEYLEFLKRYRQHRGLSSLPSKGSLEPVIESRVKNRGLGSRQLRNIVEHAFNVGCQSLLKDGLDTHNLVLVCH